jgi:hypothetical protein
MVHSGYEASAVHHTFSLKGIFTAARASLFGGTYANREALEALQEKSAPASHVGLVQVRVSAPAASGVSNPWDSRHAPARAENP